MVSNFVAISHIHQRKKHLSFERVAPLEYKIDNSDVFIYYLIKLVYSLFQEFEAFEILLSRFQALKDIYSNTAGTNKHSRNSNLKDAARFRANFRHNDIK
jgi:hypothetical protein